MVRWNIPNASREIQQQHRLDFSCTTVSCQCAYDPEQQHYLILFTSELSPSIHISSPLTATAAIFETNKK